MAGRWVDTVLGQLLSFANGRSSPERADGLPYPVYGSNGVIGYSADANADEGSLIIGRVGSYCGSLYYSKHRCWVTDNAIRANALGNNDSRFLFYLLSTLNLNNWRAGSGQPLLNQDILSRIPTSVPEPVEQRASAHILGTLDDKIELNRRMSATLEAMARALFKAWFVDFEPVRAKMEGRWQRGQSLPGLPAHLYDLFPHRLLDSELGEIPEEWGVAQLDDVAEIQGGKQLPPEECRPTGQYPVFGANGVMGYAERTTHDGFIIAFGRVGAYCGSVHWTYHGAWINNNASSVAPTRWPEFVLQTMLVTDFQHMRTGSAQPFIPNSALEGLLVLQPPEEVLDTFCSIVRPIRLSQQVRVDESRTLAALRDALLPKLISGELRVKDAETFMERVAS